jgi:hypothetical protein
MAITCRASRSPLCLLLVYAFTAANTFHLRAGRACRLARSRPMPLPSMGEKDGRGHSYQAGRFISLGLVALAPPSSTTRSQCPTMPQCKSMARVEPLIGPSHVFGQASGSHERAKIGGGGGGRRRGETPSLMFLAACPAAHCKDHALLCVSLSMGTGSRDGCACVKGTGSRDGCAVDGHRRSRRVRLRQWHRQSGAGAAFLPAFQVFALGLTLTSFPALHSQPSQVYFSPFSSSP